MLKRERNGSATGRVPSCGVIVAAAILLAASQAAARGGGACSRTAELQFAACKHEVNDDRLVAKASCVNVGDAPDRADCMAGLRTIREEGNQLCREQRAARFELCDAIGEDPYDPSFDAGDFETEFTSPTVLNPYLPLEVGNFWEFAAPSVGETNTVEVLARTKLVAGVTCVVSRDLVSVNGVAKEFTDDWLAQASNGDVIYCGEEVKDYEIFPGDDPADPELVSIDGSFKVGRDETMPDKPGTFFFADPAVYPGVGKTYRQEYSLGNAEDVATVLTTTYGYGNDMVLDEHVPQALADHLCNDDCVVTLEGTPVEPGVTARKYYAASVGVFLEVDVETGEVNRLIACNVDPRCTTLPQP